MVDVLFWKVQKQDFSVMIQSNFTSAELLTWQRIRAESENLLDKNRSPE
ncbi:hypothetical protein [Allofournierella massiliensis]